jgi:hypothetical protein
MPHSLHAGAPSWALPNLDADNAVCMASKLACVIAGNTDAEATVVAFSACAPPFNFK